MPPPPPRPPLSNPLDKKSLDSKDVQTGPPPPPESLSKMNRDKKHANLLRATKIFFFFVSPLGLATGIWAFVTSGGDDEPATSPPPAVIETTIAPETSLAVTTTQPLISEPSTGTTEVDWEQLARSVVLIYLPDCDGESWMGSGTIVLDGGYVLTNHHVTGSSSCEMEIYAIDSIRETPNFISYAELIPNAFDQGLDLSVIRLVDTTGSPTIAVGRTPIEITEGEIDLGTSMKVLGFPAMGGVTISMTTGEHSGWWEDTENFFWTDEFYKTSAKMGPGVSGGAAFEAETGQFIGVPTGTPNAESEGDVLGLVRPSRYALPLLEAAENSN